MSLVTRRKHGAIKSARNRAMMAAFEGGASISKLMVDYGLGEKRIRAILADERNRRRNSPDPFYRTMRAGAQAD
ncbi:MAG: hypothetical protein H0U98_16560 [Alphaproteobacteria bacterium]|nr:hypothetical protein [Alphaproteobacteria bacterium]